MLVLPLSVQAEKKKVRLSALDEYLEAVEARGATAQSNIAAGSLYAPGGVLADIARDASARQVDDLVTILVSDRASAIVKGNTNTSRKSSTNQTVGSFLGKTNPLGKYANLAATSGQTQLQGDGQTSRDTVLTTTVSARVTHVLPNGNLVVEGQKHVAVSSEQQTVTVRGLVRPADIGPANTIRSDQVAQLEIRVNGKGVVGDAVRRPFILYRLLLGILPF
jgi:flagellar L-ring protein FlgH